MLIILELEFDLCAIDTASLVDLLNSNFCTMLYSQTINCCTTGYRADAESEPPHAVKDAAITTAKPALKNLFFIIVSSSHDCI